MELGKAIKKVKTIDTYSATSKSRVHIPIDSWASQSTHQVKFIATGDKNANSLGKKVVIDGIAVLK